MCSVEYLFDKYNFFLSAKIGLPVAAEPLTDKSGRTPLSAVFWNITKDDIPEDMR